MEKTVILFGSTTGNTENIADTIAEKIGNGIGKVNVAGLSVDDIKGYKNIIIGVSTWGIGDLQDDWDEFLPQFAGSDLSGKTIAFYGLGDADGYPDSFVDGIGIIYEEIKDKGCTVVGQVDTDDYTFDDSKAVFDGKFIGLPLDEDGESDKTEGRIDKWISQIIPDLQ